MREGSATKKSSGKKLVQARLPFKIISSGDTPSAGGSSTTKAVEPPAKEGRKRKLSYEGEEKSGQCDSDDLRGRSASKENLTIAKKKKTDEGDDIILLDDDDIFEEDPEQISAEKMDDKEVATKKKNQNVGVASANTTKSKPTKGSSVVNSPRTPKQKEIKGKDANTPKNTNSEKSNTPAGGKNKSIGVKASGSSIVNSPQTPKPKKIKGKEADTPKKSNTPASAKNKPIGVKASGSSAVNSPKAPKPKEIKGKDADTPKSTNAKKSNTPASAKNKPIGVKASGSSAVNSPQTPKPKEVKEKDADTPKSTKVKKSNTPASAKNKSSGSATKVQIKLPLGSAKSNKRRKSKLQAESVEAELVISSDENDTNPIKKLKIDGTPKRTADDNGEKIDKEITVDLDKLSSTTIDEIGNSGTEENSNLLVLEIGGNEIDVADSELESRCSSILKEAMTDGRIQTLDKNDKPERINSSKQNPIPESSNKTHTGADNHQHQNANNASTNSDKDVTSTSKNEVELTKADEKYSTERSICIAKETNISVVITSSSDSENSRSVQEESNSHIEGVPKIVGTFKIGKEDANKEQKKNLTPKQIKLMEQRRKGREEKERRLQEEKMQKQREKEAKELAKKREREEREDQRRKEREEREEQKRKEREERDEQKRNEREEKERKRLAEQEAKNEEKRKRNEVKEEELRKKEEERKRKEGADLKAKKEAEAFQKFFKAKRTSNGDSEACQQQTHQDDGYDPEMLAFRPFEIKGDMKLAPLRRKQLSPECRQQLDVYLVENTDTLPQSQDLYLAELKSGKITAGKWRRISVDTKASDDDIQIIDDDIDRAGLAIVEETHAPIEHFRTKFYKFHENRRPPFYGTWRKRTAIIKPRRPFAQDKKYFDYDVDSDLEWEEEEPGESLDGSDDEKEKESEDDDYEVDNEWFVPHGHLSEEELQNEDEVLDADTREAQKVKLQVLQQEFAQEMKKKTEKIKPRLIGCIWTDENGNQPALCPKIIWDTLNTRAMLCVTSPLLEDPEVSEKSEVGSPTANVNEKTVEKIKPIKITEQMLKDLVRLVHGNHHSKNFLIKEFIAFLEANEESIKNGEVRGPNKSIIREKIDDFAEWTITESIKALQNNRKKNKKRLCWVVSADILKNMELENLGLNNTWKYTLQPRSGQDRPSTKADVEAGTETDIKDTAELAGDEKNGAEDERKSKSKTVKNKSKSHIQRDKKVKTNLAITKFTKLLPTNSTSRKSPKATITQQTKTDLKVPTVDTKPSTTTTKPAEPPATKVKKRVPLLMSVPRGQQISQPTKNALISEFLQKTSDEKEASSSKIAQAAPTNSSNEISEVVELD